MRCFCGCGRKVAFGMKAVSKRGQIIGGDVANARGFLNAGVQSPSGEMFVHDDEIMLSALAEAVHAGIDPGPELESETRGFMAFGRNFNEAGIGAAVRRSGLSSDEAAAMLIQGEWDPWADLEIPT
jgi:hypothetical protein